MATERSSTAGTVDAVHNVATIVRVMDSGTTSGNVTSHAHTHVSPS